MQPSTVHPSQKRQMSTIYRRTFLNPICLLFFMLVGLSVIYQVAPHSAVTALHANGTIPGGTIPPGGTLPPPAADPENGQIRLLHLAPFNSAIAGTEIDVCVAVNNPVSGLTGLTYLQSSGYVSVAPGTYNWSVGTPGCTTILLTLPAIQLFPGSAQTVIVTGDGTNQPITAIVVADALGRGNSLYLPIIQQ